MIPGMICYYFRQQTGNSAFSGGCAAGIDKIRTHMPESVDASLQTRTPVNFQKKVFFRSENVPGGFAPATGAALRPLFDANPF